MSVQRLIDANALKEQIDYCIKEAGWSEHDNRVLGWCKEFIDNAPTVNIKDQIAGAYNEGYMCGNKEAEKARPQGEWINSGVDISGHRLNRCSICNGVYQMSYVGDSITRWNYCPNCGADMKGGREE